MGHGSLSERLEVDAKSAIAFSSPVTAMAMILPRAM